MRRTSGPRSLSGGRETGGQERAGVNPDEAVSPDLLQIPLGLIVGRSGEPQEPGVFKGLVRRPLIPPVSQCTAVCPVVAF